MSRPSPCRNRAALVEVSARGSADAVERATFAIAADPALAALAHSVVLEGDGILRLDAWPSEAETDPLLEALAGLKVARRTLADADWVALSLSGLPPVRAGRFFVHGAHDAGEVPANAVALRIEAGAAFGTGHHATTLGCLLALDRLLRRGQFAQVLDVGTGTGVLAIAAAKAGAAMVLGTDLDPVAVRIAGENARLNGVRARFRRSAGPLTPIAARTAPFELVFANILAGPLVALAPALRRLTRRGGFAILAGLLTFQTRSVEAAFQAQGFRRHRVLRLGEWATLVLRRN